VYATRMESQLVLFLALTSVTLITNALMIWLGYRVLSRITSAMKDVKIDRATRTWVTSLQTASAEAATFTETAKQAIMDSEGNFAKAQEEYSASLRSVESSLAAAATNISTTAETIRDAVARPAFAIVNLVSRLRNIKI
jgi:hypothetical protein